MATTPNLSLPYYLNNNPVIRLSDKINDGVIVNTNNILSGEKITFDNKYFNIQNPLTLASSFIYIDSANKFGSLSFPDKKEINNNNSFILTADNTNEIGKGGSGWKWTNILNLPLTKYLNTNISFTYNVDTIGNIDINNIDSNENAILFFDSSKYNYIGLFDLYINLDTIYISDLIKNNQGLCIAINSIDNPTNIDINNILDITNTVNNKIHKVKILNNIISPTIGNNTCELKFNCYIIDKYDAVFNNIDDKDADNITINISKITRNINIKIYGTLTIFEFKK